MTEKLGFTFYPKDWWASDSYFELEPKEKYIYLECLFLMYMNDGYMCYSKEQIEKRFSVKLSEDEFNRIVGRFIKDEKGYTSLTVNKRMSKAISSRENGKLGGRPKKDESLSEEEPKKPNEKTQNNPPSEIEKKEKGKRIEKKEELDVISNFPFTDDFRSSWDSWKDYKKREFKFTYKSRQSEEAALNHLKKLCSGNIEIALEIINQSMANGWQGFFELKNFSTNKTEISTKKQMVM